MNAASLNILRHPIMEQVWDLGESNWGLNPDNWPDNLRKTVELDDELAEISYRFGLGTDNIMVKSKVKMFVNLVEGISDDLTGEALDNFKTLKKIAV